MAFTLVDIDRYKTAIGETDDANDQLHTDALEDATATLLDWTDRDFVASTVAESRDFTYRGTGFLEIDDATTVTSVTSNFPITAWAAHTDGPASLQVFSWLELPQYNASAAASIGAMGFTSNLDLLFQQAGFLNEWTVTVTGTWGINSVPGDMKRACIWLAHYFEQSSGSGGSGDISAEQVAETSRSYVIQPPPQPTSSEDAGIPTRVQALAWPFKRHVL